MIALLVFGTIQIVVVLELFTSVAVGLLDAVGKIIRAAGIHDMMRLTLLEAVLVVLVGPVMVGGGGVHVDAVGLALDVVVVVHGVYAQRGPVAKVVVLLVDIGGLDVDRGRRRSGLGEAAT